MAIERHAIENREQWLGLRKQDVTASVAGALLGVHEYSTPYALWALKSGLIHEDPEESGPMKRGRLLEPVAVELLRELRPTWKIERGTVYLRDPDSRIGATPDVFVEDPDRGPGIVQLKSVEQSIFRKKWKDAETGEVKPPLWIAVQGIIEAHLAKEHYGVNWVGVAPLVVSFGVELPIIDDIPMHAGVFDRLKHETELFWRRVASGDAPPADYTRDGEVIAMLYGETNGETIDLSDDERFAELILEDQRLGALCKEADEHAKARKAVRTEIIAKLQHAAAATCNGHRVAAATVNRKAYSVAASSYRQVRISTAA